VEQAKLDRINELTRLARERELSPAEISEREILRKEYVSEWRAGAEATLKKVVILEPDGTKHKLREKKK
jgi:uncharacterized protein YnzC (UPF0291/DUF896 family)